jgi:hypothetical protein
MIHPARQTGLWIALCGAVLLLCLPACSPVSKAKRGQVSDDKPSLESVLAELRELPPGEVSRFLEGRAKRRELAPEGSPQAGSVVEAETAWLEKTVEAALDDARALLKKDDPGKALATLTGLIRKLALAESFKDADARVRKLSRRAVVACLEAAGQTVRPLLLGKQYEEASRVANRLEEDLGDPARAVGLGQELRDFQAAQAYLATLARRARPSSKD